MDLHQLKLFAAVYQNKSFTKAAELLHISQPTISEHMKNLEAELGCSLFDRVGRTIIPTVEADALFPKALLLLEDFDRLKETVASVGEHVKGKIVMGASSIPGTYLIPALASDFKKKNPGVSFEIVMGDSMDIAKMVVNHELLLGVVGAKMVTEPLQHVPFVTDELVLAAADTVTKKKSMALEELSQLPFLIREQGSGTRKTMEQYMEQLGMSVGKFNIVAVLGSSAAIKEALKSGLGAAVISRLAIREELQRGDLHEVKMKSLEMNRDFFLITRKKRTLPSHYQEFYDYLQGSKPG